MNTKAMRLKANWESYILRRELSEDTRPCVKEAWDRCIAMKVDYNDGFGHVTSKEELEKRLVQNENLIKIAAPIMENIFEIIRKTSFSIILSDSEGVLIHVIENESIHTKHSNLKFFSGTHWDEGSVGSNAIGTALARKEAIHMIGAEHYCLAHHPWTCSAALIKDTFGKIVGCLDISGSVEDEHIHTFGIVTTAAAIIEKQLNLMASYQLINTAFNSVQDGFFVIDNTFGITHMNDKMVELLGIRREEIAGIDVREMFKDIEIQNEILCLGRNIRLNDYTINHKRKNLECMINISPTIIDDQISGAVFLIKEATNVRRVVSRLAGFSSGYTFDDLVTCDDKLRSVIKFAKKIAEYDCTVLIQGESGTGKEIFAHSIHHHSSRREGPFIAINCAALPKDLVESELFGYEKGAFTGASNEGKPGKFELANGGTMFLDEIGELPMEIQSKLLRVLDNQKVSRIGSRYERDLDVRIIAATNRDLEREIEIKGFREDLYFRLNVIKLSLIPLRERKNDILLLADEFINRMNHENKGEEKHFSKPFRESLMKNPWKGNVRELQNYIQREYYLSDGDTINGSSIYMEELPTKIDFKNDNLQNVEKLCIVEALRAANGNAVEAAERLKIGKSTIYRKILSYHIDVQPFKEHAGK